MWKLIETHESKPGHNAENQVSAIVEHDGSRLLIAQGKEHEAMPYSWHQGRAARLLPDDTFDRLHNLPPINDYTSAITEILDGYDETRPALNMSGNTIHNIAAKLPF